MLSVPASVDFFARFLILLDRILSVKKEVLFSICFLSPSSRYLVLDSRSFSLLILYIRKVMLSPLIGTGVVLEKSYLCG